MRAGPASFLGGFLGALLQPLLTRAGRRLAAPLLVAGALVLAAAVQWWQGQPLWLRLLLTVLTVVLLLRPWRWDRTRLGAAAEPREDA